MKRIIFYIGLLISGILLFFPPLAHSTTLTNQDVQAEQQNQGGATYTNKDVEYMMKQNPTTPNYSNKGTGASSSSSSGHPTVPPAGVSSGSSSGGPTIVKKYLPYTQWEDEYKQYFSDYYHINNLVLQPKLIVMHYSGTSSLSQLWYTYVNGKASSEGTRHFSCHFVIDKDGSIYQWLPVERKSISAYGVNHVSISVEMIAQNESELLGNAKQMKTSYQLVKWLMKQYKIPKEKVYGHYEIGQGKDLVSEYLDYMDKDYPDRYPPTSSVKDPGKTYMFKLRYYINENAMPE